MVEQLGSGVPRILESYGKASFKFSPNFLRMTFEVVDQHENIDTVSGGQMGGAIGGAIDDLTDRQKEVLTIIKLDEKISYRSIADQLKINTSAVLKHLEVLKTKGHIERIGGTRGYWKVITSIIN